MIETILESPWVVLAVGLVCSFAFFQVWLQMARTEGLWLSGGTLILSIALVVLGVYTETEKEVTIREVTQMASDLEKNFQDKISAAIYSKPTQEVIAAHELYKRSDFRQATITRIHSIEITGPTSARKAEIKMNVFIEASLGGMQVRAPRYVELTLYFVDKHWRVYDFKHADAFQGLKETNSP